MARALTTFIGLIAAAASACTPTLTPASEAVRVPGLGGAAWAEDAGVELTVSAEAWRGVPPDLDETVTPLLVTITNDSDRRLEVRYEHFTLVAPTGLTFAALPPFQISGVVYSPMTDTYPPAGFGVAPYLSPWYPGWGVWGGPFPYRAGYYDMYYSAFQRITLPTGDMIQKALPEGVLEPHGRITGFLYFAEVEHVPRVTFVAELVDADADAMFGVVQIPFDVR